MASLSSHTMRFIAVSLCLHGVQSYHIAGVVLPPHAAARVSAPPCLALPMLDGSTFQSTVDGFDGITAVKFFAPWCRTCRSIEAPFEKLAKQQEQEHAGQIQFAQVDFKANKALCLGERIYQLPTVHFYVKGLGRINRFVLTPSNARKRVNGEVERFLGDTGHLQLLQSLRSTALNPMIKYVDLVNVVNALCDAPRYLEEAESASKMVVETVTGDTGRKALEDLFASLDTNRNGVLDNDEIEAILHAIGMEERMPAIADAAKLTLDREAFVRLMTSKAVSEFDKPERALLPAFQALDVNGDGVLERSEVIGALERLPGASTRELQSSQFFDAFDVDKNGTLDYEEFVALMSGAAPLGAGSSR